MIDTRPPTIKDLSLAGRGKKGILQFHLSDNVDLPDQMDYPFFKVTLNGQWIRMRSDSKSGIISGHLPVDLKKGKYEIKVTDTVSVLSQNAVSSVYKPGFAKNTSVAVR